MTEYDREQGPRYATELDAAAAILQRVHPMGRVMGFGRLHVVQALTELFPADDAEPVTESWLRAVLPNTASYGRQAHHRGRFGRLMWEIGMDGSSFCVWLNGELLRWQAMGRGQFRRLAAALGILLTEGT